MSSQAMFSRCCELRWLYRMLPLLLVGCTWATGQCNAQTSVMAHQVKAAMLYKFLAYVEWPSDTFPAPVSPYVIAVVGAADMVDELHHITANRSINDRTIAVRSINPQDNLDGIHLLFVGRDVPARLRKPLLKRSARQATVTVTESEAGLIQNCIINFRPVGDRIGFDVSLVTARERNLKLSARLLAVATYVETGEP